MSEQKRFFKGERIENGLNERDFRIVGTDRLENATAPPTIGWRLAGRKIAIDVWTNIPNLGKQDGKFSTTLSLSDAGILFSVLGNPEELEPGNCTPIAIAEVQWYDDKENPGKRKPSDPKLSMTVTIGRDDDGVVYMQCKSWNNTFPVVKVPMLPSNMIKLGSGDGRQASRVKVSELVAKSWARTLSDLVSTVYALSFQKPKAEAAGGDGQSGQAKEPWRGNNNGGNSQFRGNNRGNYNNQGNNNYRNNQNQQQGGQGGSNPPPASHSDSGSFESDFGNFDDNLPM